ncbi:MAG: apiosidase-like domain-containing protein [Planctomycetota bacterium]|jgi:hypothetical protein
MMRRKGDSHKHFPFFVLLFSLVIFSGTSASCFAQTCHIWEKVEITLQAEKTYQNPYAEVEVWIDLTGPDFEKRCYGFWDGENIFRVRVMATKPGQWKWVSSSNQSDTGLNDKKGTFNAVAWTQEEKQQNSCRRGMVKSSANGHAFEYDDGTIYFLLGDTWWATSTFRYPWYEPDKERPMGPEAGFKDYVKYRQKQEYNCIAMIAALPNWANDDKPDELETEDGTELRGAWRQAGTNSAKDMHDEEGNRAFEFPGKVPGFENYFPDINRINPRYFHYMDKKIDYLNAHGFIPFIEVSRRDIGPAWKRFYQWPESYTRYIQYIWSRYQANICFFSPIHLDWDGSLPAKDWNVAANSVIERYGHPPFGTLVSCNATGSSLENFGHVDEAKWISFHQIGNFHRRDGHGHRSYHLLTDMHNAKPAMPAINGEPYYDGQHETVPGSETAALFARSAMYGSVLSGGLGGHIYGAGKEGYEGGAMWGGNVEPAANFKIWDGIQWVSGDQMQHLRTFILSEGRKYQELVPMVELVNPNKSGKENDWLEWAYCLRTEDKEFFLLYFEKGCRRATLSGAIPKAEYKSEWFNPRTGTWKDSAGRILKADSDGKIVLPKFPGNLQTSDIDWGMKAILKH